jgi:hypothetical protein
VTFSEDELKALLREWQKILRLQDWDVVVRFARRYEFNDEDNQGECSWVLDRREALIKILASEDYNPNCIYPHDVEGVLVHELLHLHMAPWRVQERMEDVAKEQAIEAIAKALVSLKRGTAGENCGGKEGG